MVNNGVAARTPETVGDRIRAWRRRRGGMSQTTLAGLAGISQSYLSQIESGRRPLDRKSVQAAIASALSISVAQLLGKPGEAGDPQTDRATAHVPAIRAVLIEIGAGQRRAPRRDLDQVRADVATLTERRNAADYASVAPLLPDLLLDLAGHNGEAAAQTVEALFAARYTLKTLGYPDLAREAAEIGVRVATEHETPAWRGQALYSWVQSFPPESAALGATLTARAADELQSASDQDAQEVYGCLHILAGFQAAVSRDAASAWAHLEEAGDVAASLGQPRRTGELSAGVNGNWFGPTQVAVWRVAVAAELGDLAAAETVSASIDLSELPVPNRHVYYWTDMARVLASAGQDDAAVAALVRAERAAPQHFRLNPVVRDLFRALVRRAKARALAGSMADLGRRLGIDPL